MITYGREEKKIKIVQALTPSAYFYVSGCLTTHICGLSTVCPLEGEKNGKRRAVEFADVLGE